MKTTMQKLIEWMEMGEGGWSTNDIITKANELIEDERQQIIDAYWGGLNGSINDWSEAKVHGSYITGIKEGEGGEQYYRETFKK